METLFSFQSGQFLIIGQAEPDTGLDLSWDDTGEVRANLESGLWCAFVAKAAVIDRHGVEIGADYLGGCIYENPSEFFRASSGYFPDMVRAACGEARQHLREAAQVKVRANA